MVNLIPFRNNNVGRNAHNIIFPLEFPTDIFKCNRMADIYVWHGSANKILSGKELQGILKNYF